MKKLLYISIAIGLATSLQAVEVNNKSTMPIKLMDFCFRDGREIYQAPFTLAPGEKYIDNNIASFAINLPDQMVQYYLSDLETNTIVNCEMNDGKFMVYKIGIIEPNYMQLFFNPVNTVIQN